MDSAPPGQRSGSPQDAVARRPLPFWVLQAAELGIALVLIDVSAHIAGGALLVFAAAALALLALCARGPLGIVRVCGPRLHVMLCVAVAALVLVALVFPQLRPGTTGLVVVVVAMVGVVRIATLTRTDGNPLPRGVWPARVIDASATVADGPSAGGPPPPTPPTAPAVASSETDGTAGTAERRAEGGPTPGVDPTSTSDRLARLAGEAVATGQRAARQKRPALEASARRGLRSLGRAVGRMGR